MYGDCMKQKWDVALNEVTGTFSRSFTGYFILLSLAIISLEAIFDLKKNLFWLRLGLMLDFLLIASYFLLLASIVYKNRVRFLSFIREERGDLIYALFICSMLFMPRLAALMIILRLTLAFLMTLFKTPFGKKLVGVFNLKPSQTLALSFLALIFVGTLLLMLPAATSDGKGATLINALFTMTSASCVAGLTVYDLGVEFSRFGQAVILFGMQAGGLGIMVLSAAFAVLVGGKITSRRQSDLGETLDTSTPEGLSLLIRSIASFTVILELIGAVFLFFAWNSDIPRFSDRLWWSIFHAVSAFCNAGLALFHASFEGFVNDPFVCFIFIVLISAGGLGFFVLMDLTSADVWKVKKPKAVWDRLQIQTKVVVIAYIALDLFGLLVFLFFEYDGALHGLSLPNKISAAFFNVVNLRSAGFTVVPLGALAAPTIVFSVVYMFIGAAPGGTGGGIKVTTAAVSIMALRAMLRGRQDVEICGRRLPSTTVNRSVSIVLVAALFLAIFFIFLLATQTISFERLLFEMVSAFGTVGLSLDTTSSLNNIGKLLIIVVMYVGRIGPLTMAMAIGERREIQRFQYPVGRIAVG